MAVYTLLANRGSWVQAKLPALLLEVESLKQGLLAAFCLADKLFELEHSPKWMAKSLSAEQTESLLGKLSFPKRQRTNTTSGWKATDQRTKKRWQL